MNEKNRWLFLEISFFMEKWAREMACQVECSRPFIYIQVNIIWARTHLSKYTHIYLHAWEAAEIENDDDCGCDNKPGGTLWILNNEPTLVAFSLTWLFSMWSWNLEFDILWSAYSQLWCSLASYWLTNAV